MRWQPAQDYVKICHAQKVPNCEHAMSHERMNEILDLARWAPSGDNTQPWRFEIVSANHIRIHGFDTRDHVLYDYDGHASQIAHGALLETIRIAATGFGLVASWTISSTVDDRSPVYDIFFSPDEALGKDPLFAYIKSRTVQRRPMATTPLAHQQRSALLSAPGPGFRVQMLESAAERWDIAKMLWTSAGIRLTCPEAYPVHASIIEWRTRYSKDRIPEQAVGVDPATARLMEWALRSWGRVSFLNRYLLGTIAPRIQLDLLPAWSCAAHVLIRPLKAPAKLEDWIDLGVAVQKFWLTATAHGLHLQPQMTPVIFRWYSRAGREFSAQRKLTEQSARLSEQFERVAQASAEDDFGFFARLGSSTKPRSRSIRRDLKELMNP
jgi:hypothetical protein